MPTTCRPAGPYFSWNSTNHGISTLQGAHHVAQKSRRMTFPLKSESVTSRLFTSFNVKFEIRRLRVDGTGRGVAVTIVDRRRRA